MQPEGYKVSAVEAWVVDNVPALTPPFQWTRLEGGHSNLTYQIEDQKGLQAVIRRPPQGELLPKPMTWAESGRSSLRWRPHQCLYPRHLDSARTMMSPVRGSTLWAWSMASRFTTQMKPEH